METMQLNLCLAVIVLGSSSLIQLAKSCQPPNIVNIDSFRPKTYFDSDYYQEIRLPCVATGDEPLRYQWFKNGVELSSNSGSSIADDGSLDSAQGFLYMNRTDAGDAGYYQCKVSNECGISVSPKTELVFAFLDLFPTMPGNPRVISTNVGSSVTLRCFPPASMPQPDVNWIIVHENEYMWYEPVQIDERVAISWEGYLRLHIANVRAEDEHLYRCVVSNGFTRSSTFGEDIEVRVQGREQDAVYAPPAWMWVSPSDMVGFEGEELKLMCVASGNPLPTIAWTWEDGQQLDLSRISFTDHHELVFHDIQASDAGTYGCSATSSMGRLDRTFYLLVKARPQWLNPPTDVTADPGQNVTFDCRATGRPTPTVSWYINGTPLQDIPTDPRRRLDGDILHIDEVELEDSLVVQCNATNRFGHAWADLTLHLQEDQD